jgi:hypothetical protein
LTELQLLCEEFGFTEFASKLSRFSERLKDSQRRPFENSLSGMRSAQLNESFQFVVNGSVIESDFSESAAIFPAFREQLSVDGCARKFFVNANGIEAVDIRSLQSLLSGESISIGGSEGLLSGLLGNVTLEVLFLNCSKSDTRMNLSELMIERRIELKSANLSNLSFEALDSLLLSDSISVESEDVLLEFILKLGSEYRDLLRHIEVEFLSEYGFSLLEEHFDIPSESIWQRAIELISHPPLPLPLFDSRIISDFPDIFAEFHGKGFSLLWRGSRDGFSAKEFHDRCDGHANTLTVILDTEGNIFGGFTPVEWDSHSDFKADDSQKSFLFTVKNPHNFPARRFALKAEKKQQAIYCHGAYGPWFYGGIAVWIYGNTNKGSWTNFDSSYINDTGLNNKVNFFTGSFNFQVKEIEVLEISN